MCVINYTNLKRHSQSIPSIGLQITSTLFSLFVSLINNFLHVFSYFWCFSFFIYSCYFICGWWWWCLWMMNLNCFFLFLYRYISVYHIFGFVVMEIVFFGLLLKLRSFVVNIKSEIIIGPLLLFPLFLLLDCFLPSH